MRFYKYHALGNDYLVLDPQDAGRAPTRARVRTICHRNYGLGSDGILYGPLRSTKADFGLRIFNPDGGEAEKSGNGLRIFARYLFDQGRVEEKIPFTVETPGGVVSCLIGRGARRITVEMGQVSFASDVIPVKGRKREVINEEIEVGGRRFTYCAATIGNPHCVLPMNKISKELACEFGPFLETHGNFPNDTNVQFLKVLDKKTIQIEIWERGAGYTLASGSSSSAAAAVAHRLGLVGSKLEVRMPGGIIGIEIAEDYSITMSGPATKVGDYDLADEALKVKV